MLPLHLQVIGYLQSDVLHPYTEDTHFILWYNQPPFLRKYRKRTRKVRFDKCKFTNCKLVYDHKHARMSKAIIFDGRYMPKKINFERANFQVWIFAAHESPFIYSRDGSWWKTNREYIFNWTMTYNKDNTDIFLPYGEIIKKRNYVNRDFKVIAGSKTKTVLMVASHCNTPSKRAEYVNKLREYIDVDVLGKCGKKWQCGLRYSHDSCFDILNSTYRFYLAFENALCHQYFTEKFYDNFNYDIIIISRGGSKNESRKVFPEGSHISTESFKSINELGTYLKNLSIDDYANLLKQKSQFHSTGYMAVYQRAMCELCERINHIDKYKQTITNITQWAFGTRQCTKNNNISDIH